MNIVYAISNWIYGTEPIEKAFARLKKFRYDAIELMVEDPVTLDLDEIKSLMEKYSMPVSSICTKMTGAADAAHKRNLIDEDPEVRKNTLEYIKSCMTIGEQLGAKLVLSVPSGVANVTDGWNEETQARCVESLLELGDHANDTGNIMFAIEPINRYENSFLQRGEQALQLLEKTNHPKIKMMLDFFHCNIEENNNGDSIRAAGTNLIHCHVADSNRKSTGRGMTDWFAIMRALKDIDFNGSMACEPLPPTAADVYASQTSERPEADQYAEECINYLRLLQSLI
jgi:D-psicose/D-tagatose/L-ribulose 3-epimerase